MVYVGCLFHYWTAAQSRSPAGQWLVGLQDRLLPEAKDVSNHWSRGVGDSPTQPASSGQTHLITGQTAVPGQEQTEPVTALAPTNDLSEETVKEVSTLSMQATSASEPSERGKAIVKLRNAARTEESVQALVSVLGGDQSGQNRLFAVASLLNMARQADDDGTIKAALRRATSDEDARVAARARQALDALSDVLVAVE